VSLTVAEASDRYANFMRNPAPAGPDVCAHCWTFTRAGPWTECYSCDRILSANKHTDVVVPITYSVDGEQMHHELYYYKDGATPAIRQRHVIGLTAVLWRFLRHHERCLAEAGGIEGFDLVTTVPSKHTVRDNARGQLRQIVGDWCKHTAPRYSRVLRPTDLSTGERTFEANRFRATEALDGRAVLLIDDTWTTGTSIEAAAYTLKQAGATHVVAVPIGATSTGW
jgi:predicted amidophosphoribosyltransferase